MHKSTVGRKNNLVLFWLIFIAKTVSFLGANFLKPVQSTVMKKFMDKLLSPVPKLWSDFTTFAMSLQEKSFSNDL